MYNFAFTMTNSFTKNYGSCSYACLALVGTSHLPDDCKSLEVLLNRTDGQLHYMCKSRLLQKYTTFTIRLLRAHAQTCINTTIRHAHPCMDYIITILCLVLHVPLPLNGNRAVLHPCTISVAGCCGYSLLKG